MARSRTREDPPVLLSFLPANWHSLALETGALRGLRKDKSAEQLLRVLLVHFGSGRSLRETAAWAQEAQLADLSSVAVWSRSKKSRGWLRALCGNFGGELQPAAALAGL